MGTVVSLPVASVWLAAGANAPADKRDDTRGSNAPELQLGLFVLCRAHVRVLKSDLANRLD